MGKFIYSNEDIVGFLAICEALDHKRAFASMVDLTTHFLREKDYKRAFKVLNYLLYRYSEENITDFLKGEEELKVLFKEFKKLISVAEKMLEEDKERRKLFGRLRLIGDEDIH